MDNSLIYGLATLFFGFLALIVKYGFKSKCTQVVCCFGLFNVYRDIEKETVEPEEKKEDFYQVKV